MIGLIDLDFQTSASLVPNLEIMKLGTYLTLEENKYCKLINLDEIDLEGYSKIYIFSEAESLPAIPSNVLSLSNVIYGGTAFTNGIYVPFKNSLIDYTMPKVAIYNKILQQRYREGTKAKVIEHILDDSYYRMYAGTEQLPIPPVYSRKRFWIFDKNIFYPNWKEIIEKITMRNPSSIMTIHPIVCSKLSQFFDARNMEKIARNNTYILDIPIPLNEVKYMLKTYKNLLLAEINKTSDIYLALGGNFPTSGQYLKDFIYKMNLLYSYWTQGIPIKIKYVIPHAGHYDPISNLSQLVERWTRNPSMYNKTINDKIPKDKSMSEVRAPRAERDKLIESFPAAKDLFFQNFNSLKKGGYWKL